MSSHGYIEHEYLSQFDDGSQYINWSGEVDEDNDLQCSPYEAHHTPLENHISDGGLLSAFPMTPTTPRLLPLSAASSCSSLIHTPSTISGLELRTLSQPASLDSCVVLKQICHDTRAPIPYFNILAIEGLPESTSVETRAISQYLPHSAPLQLLSLSSENSSGASLGPIMGGMDDESDDDSMDSADELDSALQKHRKRSVQQRLLPPVDICPMIELPSSATPIPLRVSPPPLTPPPAAKEDGVSSAQARKRPYGGKKLPFKAPTIPKERAPKKKAPSRSFAPAHTSRPSKIIRAATQSAQPADSPNPSVDHPRSSSAVKPAEPSPPESPTRQRVAEWATKSPAFPIPSSSAPTPAPATSPAAASTPSRSKRQAYRKAKTESGDEWQPESEGESELEELPSDEDAADDFKPAILLMRKRTAKQALKRKAMRGSEDQGSAPKKSRKGPTRDRQNRESQQRSRDLREECVGHLRDGFIDFVNILWTYPGRTVPRSALQSIRDRTLQAIEDRNGDKAQFYPNLIKEIEEKGLHALRADE